MTWTDLSVTMSWTLIALLAVRGFLSAAAHRWHWR